jgi:hypothetical protein
MIFTKNKATASHKLKSWLYLNLMTSISKSMKYIHSIALLAILYASNPSAKDYQNRVKEKISDLIKIRIPSDEKTTSSLGEFDMALGNLFGNSLIKGIVKEILKRKEYFFFSLTSIEYNG